MVRRKPRSSPPTFTRYYPRQRDTPIQTYDRPKSCATGRRQSDSEDPKHVVHTPSYTKMTRCDSKKQNVSYRPARHHVQKKVPHNSNRVDSPSYWDTKQIYNRRLSDSLENSQSSLEDRSLAFPAPFYPKITETGTKNQEMQHRLRAHREREKRFNSASEERDSLQTSQEFHSCDIGPKKAGFTSTIVDNPYRPKHHENENNDPQCLGTAINAGYGKPLSLQAPQTIGFFKNEPNHSVYKPQIHTESGTSRDRPRQTTRRSSSVDEFRKYLENNGVNVSSIDALLAVGFWSQYLLPLLSSAEGQNLLQSLNITEAQRLVLALAAKQLKQQNAEENCLGLAD